MIRRCFALACRTASVLALAGVMVAGIVAVSGSGMALAQESAGGAGKPANLIVPYVPTEPEVVKAMLDMARVKAGDKLYDLGCGDGRIVITAVKDYGARGVGIDLNPERIAEAKQKAKAAGVDGKVDFREQDLMKADFSDADVVTLYLLPRVNLQLRPQLWRQLKPGTRVVSHDFDMGPDWPPEQTRKLEGATIYRWTITAKQKALAPR